MVRGEKRVETRSRPTAPGWLLIHAAKLWTGRLADVARERPFADALSRCGYRNWSPAGRRRTRRLAGLPLGAIVGAVKVVECFPTGRVVLGARGEDVSIEEDKGGRFLCVPPDEYRFGDYSAGRWAWLCAGAQYLPRPVPWPGRQSVFGVPADRLPAELLGMIES